MKIVKFKKAHISGIEKGAIKRLEDKHALRMEESGFTSEATEDQLTAYNEKQANKKIVSTIEEAKAEANYSNSDCVDCGDEPCEECEDKENVEEKIYHILTQEDIDANGDAAEGLEVGDEVEISDADELLTDEDGKLLKKELGNV